jgi:hypothetical protein
MTMKTSNIGRVGALGLVVALAAAAALVALLTRPEAARSVDPPVPAKASFSALRGGGPVTKIPSAKQRAWVAEQAAGATPVVVAGAATEGAHTYLASSGPSICLVVDLGDGVGPVGCAQNSATFAKENLGATITVSDGGYVVSGAAPDGVHAISLTTKDGEQPVDVVNNTFAVRVASTPQRIDWRDGDNASGTYAFVNPDVTLGK